MIQAVFEQHGMVISGFFINGHAGAGDYGFDLVCAAVSSAVYMAANTLIEIQGIDAAVEESDGYFRLILPSGSPDSAQSILSGLRLHLQQLQNQYTENITVEITEV